MRKRLRETYSQADLEKIYRDSYKQQAELAFIGESTPAPDHDLRIAATHSIARELVDPEVDKSGADLSAGHGDILRRIPLEVKYFGDPFYDGYQYQGPIEDTIEQIPSVDVFVLTETLEHLDDPDYVLRQIRRKAKKLILSTPETANGWVDENPEHYWSWDNNDVAFMLGEAGFVPVYFHRTSPPKGYVFQIWGCD